MKLAVFALASATLCCGQNTSTASPASAVTATMAFSLEDYWNVNVGPVVLASVTTTASATPIPSTELIPPPGLFYSPFPSGQQVPLSKKNSSWAFPKDFFWGVASAAYQVEGGVKAEGRGPSIWDVLTHRATDYIVNNNTGDVGDNQYYMYKQDIARIAALGVPYYSISISWSRIFPLGHGQINEAGLQHYDDVIATCKQHNVQPTITLYHWDMPLYLQNLYGGWLSTDVVDDFAAYARVAFSRWGSQVQHWFTINEPIVFCDTYPLPAYYFTNTTIPAKQQPYFCGQNAILAHATAYRLGKSIFSNMTGASNNTISFKNNGGYKIPLTSSAADAQAVERAWAFNEGWFADPIFLTGDYPAALKTYVSTFLPDFTTQQKTMINGSADIFAHDAYTSQFYYAPDVGIAACMANTSNPLYPGCFNTSYTYSAADGGWNIGYAADPGSPWLHKATDWLPAFLAYIQRTWKPRAGIAVTEFGFAEPYEGLKTLLPDIQFDLARSTYYHDYMEAVLIAISEGTKVVGALAWSIVDNLEWQEGFSVKFGMQYVNFSSPTLERSYKASFFYYVDAFRTYGATMGGNVIAPS